MARNHVLAPERRIPLWLKLAYTAFVAVLVPYYWHAYGPLNFLYFCDVALLLTLPAIWLESQLLVSVSAVAILLPQTVWVVDFVARAVTGAGLLGMTDYMFDPNLPLFVRGLSSFHGWMPILLIYLLWRLGYDGRAFGVQCACGVGLLLACYLFTPAPGPEHGPGDAVNINYVFGLSTTAPQAWMPGTAWIALLVAAFPVGIYLPTHLLLRRAFGRGC